MNISVEHSCRLPLTMSSALGTDLACSCGRIFAQHNALSNHQRNCRTTKAHIADVLGKAKDMLHARKRRRLENQNSCVSSSVTSSSLPVPDPGLEEVWGLCISFESVFD